MKPGKESTCTAHLTAGPGALSGARVRQSRPGTPGREVRPRGEQQYMDTEASFWMGIVAGILLMIAARKAKTALLRYFDERYGGR